MKGPGFEERRGISFVPFVYTQGQGKKITFRVREKDCTLRVRDFVVVVVAQGQGFLKKIYTQGQGFSSFFYNQGQLSVLTLSVSILPPCYRSRT